MKKGIFHLSGPVTYSIIDMVKEIATFYRLGTENIAEVSSSTLSQPAKRPPVTGFDLTKAEAKLGYAPMNLRDSLMLLEEELKGVI